MNDRIEEFGSRRCIICGCYLPRYVFEECSCSKCGAYYTMRGSY